MEIAATGAAAGAPMPFGESDSDYLAAKRLGADREATRIHGMNSDHWQESWIDADATGLKRVHHRSGDTLEIVGETKAPWSELPSLAIRARFGDLSLEFMLDRQGNLREVGSRQEVVLTVYERLRYSRMTVSREGGAETAAAALDYSTWLRLEAFLMHGLGFWPGIRNEQVLRRDGVKGALGAFERIWSLPPDGVDRVTSTRLFYGGWRNGRWSEPLLKCQGVLHGGFRQDEASGPRQLSLALQEQPGPDWQFDASKPLIRQHSTRRSLVYRGTQNFTLPGWRPSSYFHRFDYCYEGGMLPVWVNGAGTTLPGSSEGLASWKVNFGNSERYLADANRDDSLEFRIAMYAFIQDAVLNWPMSELIFGDEHRGPPIYLELWGARYGDTRVGLVEQVVRSSNILRLFDPTDTV